MKRTIPVFVALLALTVGGSFAQNETSSFSASIKSNGTYTESASGDESYYSNMAVSYKHVFALTPEQENALNQDHRITLNFDEYDTGFFLSDDPKWGTGSTSVKVNRTVSDSYGVYKISAKAKWGKGQFSVSAKVSEVITEPFPPLIKSMRAPGHPNSTTFFETDFEGPLNFSIPGYVSYDAKGQETETVKADGSMSESASYSLKSKSLVDAPILVD